jgi:hypothetical protein
MQDFIDARDPLSDLPVLRPVAVRVSPPLLFAEHAEVLCFLLHGIVLSGLGLPSSVASFV